MTGVLNLQTNLPIRSITRDVFSYLAMKNWRKRVFPHLQTDNLLRFKGSIIANDSFICLSISNEVDLDFYLGEENRFFPSSSFRPRTIPVLPVFSARKPLYFTIPFLQSVWNLCCSFSPTLKSLRKCPISFYISSLLLLLFFISLLGLEMMAQDCENLMVTCQP